MSDSSSRDSPQWLAHGERWLIIMLLFLAIGKLGTPSKIAPLLFATASGFVGLYALYLGRRQWREES